MAGNWSIEMPTLCSEIVSTFSSSTGQKWQVYFPVIKCPASTFLGCNCKKKKKKKEAEQNKANLSQSCFSQAILCMLHLRLPGFDSEYGLKQHAAVSCSQEQWNIFSITRQRGHRQFEGAGSKDCGLGWNNTQQWVCDGQVIGLI